MLYTKTDFETEVQGKDLLGATAAIFNFIVSNSYYGMRDGGKLMCSYLCSSARHFSLTFPLFAPVIEWEMGTGEPGGSRNTLFCHIFLFRPFRHITRLKSHQ